jgi:CRP/FNR family transcriptional regulator, cyclic AMP receptor protein
MQRATLTTPETDPASDSPVSNIVFPGFGKSGLGAIYPRGTVLFREGQVLQGVYLLRTGSIKLTISSRRGKVLALRIARSGELLGVSSLLRGTPQDAAAETLEDCRADFIPRADFLRLQQTNQEVAEFVLNAVLHDVDELVRQARLLLLADSAAEKLTGLLLKWCDDHGVEDSHGIRVNNTFTQEEISQMISTSRETVTRLLGEFARRRIIEFQGNTIVIKSRISLESIATSRNAD